MAQSVPLQSPDAPPPQDQGKTPAGLTETLRHALAELDAAAVGVTRASGEPPRYFTRSAAAAEFLQEVCTLGLEALQTQTQTKNGVFGTNRVRASPGGPVLGRLIAVGLRNAHGAPAGLLIAVRMIEQPKFGPRESERLLSLAPEFAALLPAPREAARAPRDAALGPADAALEREVAPAAPAAARAPRASPAPPQNLWPAAQTPSSPSALQGSAPQSQVPPESQRAEAPPVALARPEESPGEPERPHAATSGDQSRPTDSTPASDEGERPHAPPSGDETKVRHAAPSRALAAAPDTDGTLATNLLDWTAFERQIRLQESTERLPGCVLYGDMDQLHVLNKLAGFGVGDRAISEVGGALQTADLPANACSCHLSGDRFTVYVPRTTLAQARRIAEQLCKCVAALSVDIHGVPTPLSISFGVATIPDTEGGLGHALAAAEAACKTAKDRSRGRVEVYQDADQSIVRRNDDVLVADRLRQALDAGRVEVFAQPIVRLDGTQPTANYELLVRLIGDAGTHLSPAWFMSAATRYRMLVELDRAVLTHVLAKLEGSRATLAARQLRFSVNLSGPTISDPDFLEWVASRIGGDGVPGNWLQFEITETAAVANVTQTQAMIRCLKARGVQFALDDFGTGVSSFAYLKFLDVKMLKLDGSFVRDLLGNTRSESLVRGIAQLGRAMGIETVAECVETGDVRDRLTELGIDCAQGFLFGRPTPLDGVLGSLSRVIQKD